jgi:hypothetical protein
MSTRSKLVTALAIAGATLGFRVEAGSGQIPQIRQCYRIQDVDPIDACSICMNRCLGDGYKCCIIVSG